MDPLLHLEELRRKAKVPTDIVAAQLGVEGSTYRTWVRNGLLPKRKYLGDLQRVSARLEYLVAVCAVPIPMQGFTPQQRDAKLKEWLAP